MEKHAGKSQVHPTQNYVESDYFERLGWTVMPMLSLIAKKYFRDFSACYRIEDKGMYWTWGEVVNSATSRHSGMSAKEFGTLGIG